MGPGLGSQDPSPVFFSVDRCECKLALLTEFCSLETWLLAVTRLAFLHNGPNRRAAMNVKRGFILGEWEVRPLQGFIVSEKCRKHLEPKVMDVLVCLASSPGDTVERDMILRQVWGKTAISDEVLTRCVSELRQALDDHRDNPRFVKTVPKRGYRLVEAVRPLHTVHAIEPSAYETNSITHKDTGSTAKEARPLSGWQDWLTLLRWPTFFALLSWLVIELAGVFIPVLDFPTSTIYIVALLCVVGFLIVLLSSQEPARYGQGDSSAHTAQRRAGRIVLIVLLLGGALLGYRLAVLQKRISAQVSEPSYNSIAILPFTNIDNAPAAEYFGDGLADELIMRISKVRELRVASRTSSFFFKNQNVDIPAIAERLQVEVILEGSVRRDGDRFRVNTQLTTAAGFTLWSQSFDGTISDVLEVQSVIAVEVTKHVLNRLTEATISRLTSDPTKSARAYNLYLNGRAYLNRPRKKNNLQRAAEFFSRATRMDSEFALAYAGLCEVELARYQLTARTEHFFAAEQQCQTAQQFDAELANVFGALGHLYRHSGRFVQSENAFSEALTLNPYLEDANYGLARSYEGQGRLEEAEEALLYSIAMEPGHWGPYQALGTFLHRRGRYTEALEYYRQGTEVTPEHADGFTNLGVALYDIGEWNQAEKAYNQSLSIQETPLALLNLGTLYYYQERFSAATTAYKRALAATPDDHRLWGKLAAAYRYLPDMLDESQKAYHQAISLAEERLTIDEADARTHAYLGAYYANVGRPVMAQESVARALDLDRDNPEFWYLSAVVNARSRIQDKALADIKRAVGLGYSVRLIAVDRQFKDLRQYQEFQALMEEL